MQPNAGCILGRVGVFLRRAFVRISERLLRIYDAPFAHSAHFPPILAKCQGAPRFVHSCACVRILSNDVHPTRGVVAVGAHSRRCTECAFSRDEEEC